MNWDWPGGVWFWRSIVRVPRVRLPSVRRSRSASTERYWSSLFAPRLITAAITEFDDSFPATPDCTQAASALGCADHIRR